MQVVVVGQDSRGHRAWAPPGSHKLSGTLGREHRDLGSGVHGPMFIECQPLCAHDEGTGGAGQMWLLPSRSHSWGSVKSQGSGPPRGDRI